MLRPPPPGHQDEAQRHQQQDRPPGQLVVAVTAATVHGTLFLKSSEEQLAVVFPVDVGNHVDEQLVEWSHGTGRLYDTLDSETTSRDDFPLSILTQII